MANDGAANGSNPSGFSYGYIGGDSAMVGSTHDDNPTQAGTDGETQDSQTFRSLGKVTGSIHLDRKGFDAIVKSMGPLPGKRNWYGEPEAPKPWYGDQRVMEGIFLVKGDMIPFLENMRIIDLPSVADVPRTEPTKRWLDRKAIKVQIRPSFQETFMEIAKTVAKRATCPRLSVGAVLARDNQIISTGYNGSPAGMPHCTDVGCLRIGASGCKRTTHAEANALIQAAKHGAYTEGATLFVTHRPCIDCAKLLITAGIDAVIYEAEYATDWLSEEVANMFQMARVDVSVWNR